MFYIRSFQYSRWHGLALGSYSPFQAFPYFGRFSQSGQDNLPLTQAQTHFLLTTISSRFVLILSSSRHDFGFLVAFAKSSVVREAFSA